MQSVNLQMIFVAINSRMGTLLLDTGIETYYKMYGEYFGVQTAKHKLDMPLFAFTAMYLESVNKRTALKSAGLILKNEMFNSIYDECLRRLPMQVKFSRDQSCKNLNDFYTFLSAKY